MIPKTHGFAINNRRDLRRPPVAALERDILRLFLLPEFRPSPAMKAETKPTRWTWFLIMRAPNLIDLLKINAKGDTRRKELMICAVVPCDMV